MGKRSRDRTRAARRAVAAAPAVVAGTLGAHVAPSRAVATAATWTRGNNRWDALDALTKTAETERSIQARRDRQVIAARQTGATWTSIAQVLGVSPQAVQKRYGPRVVAASDD